MRNMQCGTVQEASAAVPGWKRPSITVPADGDSSHSRRMSSSAAGSSMPWPAISPKEAVTAEQEAWCALACRGALSAEWIICAAILMMLSADVIHSEAAIQVQPCIQLRAATSLRGLLLQSRMHVIMAMPKFNIM